MVLTQPPRNPFHAALHEGIDNASRLHAALDLQFLVQHFDPKGPAAIAATVRVLSARLPVVT